MKQIFLILILCLFVLTGVSQSLEIMPGTNRVFTDVQFLKPLIGSNYKYTLFSRTRSTLTYENEPNILSMAYVNYTSKIGFGTSVIGSFSSTSGLGKALGINYFKVFKDVSVFALTAIEIKESPGYSFFTITKYKPALNEKWKLYISGEIFSMYDKTGHLISVERLRLGLEINKFQFGIGSNLEQYGEDFLLRVNQGIFLRKEF